MTVLGGSYVLIYLFVRRYLRRIGGDRARANRERYKVAQEALGGIKDLKVLGLEEGYMKTFQAPALKFARSLASNQIVAQTPQYVLQGLAFGGIVVILLVLLSAEERDINGALPILALYAFAGLRLLPALQKVYQATTKLRYSGPAVEALHADLMDTAHLEMTGGPDAERRPVIHLREELKLDHITYSYPQAEMPALTDLVLAVPARTTVGLVGATGGGKTTVVDVILGLLAPQKGALLIDGVAIDGACVRAWQRNIGYVPQQIFLIDDTVAGNIAFGLEDVDMQAVVHAARIAGLHDFVTQDLPEGYQTLVGERGIRLSGGQRQRIGIARALYRDPDVLVFDEATSALDNITEKAVMGAVHNMAHKKTIILVAHRLSTVQACDKIFLLDRGQIKASGTFNELLATSRDFREMASA
jgi:ABC-type multidrug transport system fused ATPase/permease subunit